MSGDKTILDAVTESGIAVEQLGATLLVLRTLRGLSLKKVARGAEIPVKNLAELEAGRWRPPDAVLLKVLKVLEVNLPHFLVALQEVRFIDDLARWGRRAHGPGQPMLALGEGLSLTPATPENPDRNGDGDEEPN